MQQGSVVALLEGSTFQPRQPGQGVSRRQLLLQSRIVDSKVVLIQLKHFRNQWAKAETMRLILPFASGACYSCVFLLLYPPYTVYTVSRVFPIDIARDCPVTS